MADSYIIDGYNLIHALGMIEKNAKPGGLEASRRCLLAFLAKGYGDVAGRVTVVFDARQAPRGVSRQQTFQGLHVHFAPKNQTADDWIEKLIQDEKQPRALVVVSNDMRLQNAARQRGARAWSHEMLLDFLEKRNEARTPSASRADGDETKPTHDIKEWLKEFETLESDPELKEFFDHNRFE